MKPCEHTGDDLQADPRWQLVQRIVASPVFSRSSRLSEFLLFVSRSAIEGQAAKLHEQEIGVKVFGRTTGYLQAEDNIVRANASRLRQRLEEYFATEGQHERLRVSLPKGSYVPEFSDVPAQVFIEEHVAGEEEQAAEEQHSFDKAVLESPAPSTFPWRRVLPLAVVLLLVFAVTIPWLYTIREIHATESARIHKLSPSGALWKSIFDPRMSTLVVPADSSLMLYETLTRHNLSLGQYINGDYRAMPDDGTDDLTAPKALARRRLTSTSDLDFIAQAAAVAEQAGGKLNIRYARDLQTQDFQQSNIVLIGARDANPWVSLLDNERKFSLTFDQKTRIFSIENHAQAAGGFEDIRFHPGDPEDLAYALVAYLPGLTQGKRVLILEGTSIAGTQAAVDFIFDSSELDAMLASHMRSNGALPNFEFALESHDFSGTAPSAKVIGARFW